MSLAKLSLGRNNDVINKLFPPRESLVSDIPTGDRNIEKLLLRCICPCLCLTHEYKRLQWYPPLYLTPQYRDRIQRKTKNMHGVWDPYVHSRVDSNTFTMGIGHPYVRVDFNSLPELTLSPSQGLRIWPQEPARWLEGSLSVLSPSSLYLTPEYRSLQDG